MRSTALLVAVLTLVSCKHTDPAATSVQESGPGAAGYRMCSGQGLGVDALASVPRTGAVTQQLAPAYLNEMDQCAASETIAPTLISSAAPGKVNSDGNCAYANGIVCHFHSGSEFVPTDMRAQQRGRGEIHCIVPSNEPKSPRVFGGMIECAGAAQDAHVAVGHAEGGHDGGHAVHEGAECSVELLRQLVLPHRYRCCNDGTLTNPIARLIEQGRNDVRPDFRIWQEPLRLDCALVRPMTGHPANAPALGGVGAPVFAP